MKKTTCIVIVFLAMLAAACGAAPATSTGPSSGSQGSAASGELPATTQLIVGTLKLEGSAQAVTKEQAAQLLPLWQTMKVLSESDTAAQEEKDALIEQIQETMTAGQRQAIKDMNLTRADMVTLLQGQGGLANSSSGNQKSGSQNSSSSGNGQRVFGPGGGFFVSGDRPPDGAFGGPGQNLSREQIATAQAARQAGGSSVPAALLNAVIEYLKGKAGA